MAAAILDLIAAILVFWFRDVMHAILSISAVFVINSILFLILQLPLLAVIQLLIMVGGVATYLFIGASSADFSKFDHARVYALGVLAAAVFAALVYPILNTTFTEQSNVFGGANYSLLLTNYGILYVIALSLFGVALGSIMILKHVRHAK